MALNGGCRNGNSVPRPMSPVDFSFGAFDPKALNLSVSDLYLRRNAFLELSVEALEQLDLPKIQGPVSH